MISENQVSSVSYLRPKTMKYSILLIIIMSGINFIPNPGNQKSVQAGESMFGFKNTSRLNESDWINLTQVDQIVEIIKESKKKPVLIYKHSTACGISAKAEDRLKEDWNKIDDKVKLYYLDLLAHRYVSNEVARIFNVVHQSPQLILVVNGQAVSSWSHFDVSVDSVLTEL